ncbi:hypothetical protein NSQ59_24190 [Margalitia sp. FSL K6-0131]|uniref:hypothetical protein n=1 Tax=Margalitia sp. FSL K6-0131 TaxID=2954604 RepID=UPI0030F541DA
MKTILWAAMTANGNYAQHTPKKEALDDFFTQSKAVGNFISGRRSFKRVQNPTQVFGDIDIVVLSKSVKEIPGVKVGESPQEALNYLQEKGLKQPFFRAVLNCTILFWAKDLLTR